MRTMKISSVLVVFLFLFSIQMGNVHLHEDGENHKDCSVCILNGTLDSQAIFGGTPQAQFTQLILYIVSLPTIVVITLLIPLSIRSRAPPKRPYYQLYI